MKDLERFAFTFDPARSGMKQILGDLEAEIMEIMWQHRERSVRDVHDILHPRRKLAYTTVMTVMSRLFEKRLLSRRKHQNAYVYRPRATRDDFVAHVARTLTRALVREFFKVAPMVIIHELQESPLPDEEAEEQPPEDRPPEDRPGEELSSEDSEPVQKAPVLPLTAPDPPPAQTVSTNPQAPLEHPPLDLPDRPDPMIEPGPGLLSDRLHFNVIDVRGRNFDGKTLLGRPTLLNFWATWCRPCVDALPSLEVLHQRIPTLQIVAVAAFSGGAANIRRVVDELRLTFPILIDDHILVERFKVVGFPTFLLLGPEGGTVRNFVGEITDMEDFVAPALLL